MVLPMFEFLSLAPQDPFELDYNVARCVTKDGLYLVIFPANPTFTVLIVYS
jgi:hypothetical protein